MIFIEERNLRNGIKRIELKKKFFQTEIYPYFRFLFRKMQDIFYYTFEFFLNFWKLKKDDHHLIKILKRTLLIPSSLLIFIILEIHKF